MIPKDAAVSLPLRIYRNLAYELYDLIQRAPRE